MSYRLNSEWARCVHENGFPLGPQPTIPRHDIPGRRQVLDEFVQKVFTNIPDLPSVKIIKHSIPSFDGTSIDVVEFRPEQKQDEEEDQDGKQPQQGPALVYAHPGGMIYGSAAGFQRATAAYAAESGIPFFSVDYRLAPEHRHPTAVEDFYAAVKWISSHGAKLGVDASRIGIYGESGGGGVAAGAALLARDRSLSPPLAKQILIYPMLDCRNVSGDEQLAPLTSWSWEDNITAWSALLGRDVAKGDIVTQDALLRYASPALATDLSGLPDTYIDVGTLDIFWKEGMEYAGRLVTEAKVNVEFHLYPGVPHAFEGAGLGSSVVSDAIENRTNAMQSF